MSDPRIKLKRSAVSGKIPSANDLPLGELALNTYDGKLYASKNVGIGTTVFAINPIRASTTTMSNQPVASGANPVFSCKKSPTLCFGNLDLSA